MYRDAKPPRVFISYSWESDEHKRWVRSLSERLTKNGINVRLDQWHIVPGQSLTQFMEAEVRACDFALVICTLDYCRKSLARTGGVGYEQQIITGSIAAGMPREHFIPVVRDGDFIAGPECSIPDQFLGVYAVDMREDTDMDKATEVLLRAMFKQPVVTQPSLGPRPVFLLPDTEGSAATFDESLEDMRLAILELDGWQLRSGVASHHRWPETFEIPDERERRSLVEGDVVKLQFDISIPYDDEIGDISSERMWVINHGRSGPYYLGELNNVPACSDEQEHLTVGDRVVFLPEHVISIHTRNGAEINIDA